MDQLGGRLTVSQFAKLHEVNKRTLHYYDSIGLFSPAQKGENGYRYYDARQSIDFEFIRMLKELHMGVGEIRAYMESPGPEVFLDIAEEKLREIGERIRTLRRTQALLRAKQDQIRLCQTLKPGTVQVIRRPEERLLTAPFAFEDDDLVRLFIRIKETWGLEQLRMGVGSYLSVDRLRRGSFQRYDGLFTPAMDSADRGLSERCYPAGEWLCGWHRGAWETLPELYGRMLAFAREQGLELAEHAFVMGLNDFAVETETDHITQVLIPLA